jgi:hypothetical protein
MFGSYKNIIYLCISIKRVKMKKTLMALLLIFYSISLNAQKATTFNLRVGDSEIKGLLGAEFQISRFSFSAGWRPIAKIEGKTLHSFCGALTIFTERDWRLSSWYFSIGEASKGYLYSSEYPYDNYIPEPAFTFLCGHRFNISDIASNTRNRLMFDWGVGCEMSEHNVGLAMEFLVTYSIFNNFK